MPREGLPLTWQHVCEMLCLCSESDWALPLFLLCILRAAWFLYKKIPSTAHYWLVLYICCKGVGFIWSPFLGPIACFIRKFCFTVLALKKRNWFAEWIFTNSIVALQIYEWRGCLSVDCITCTKRSFSEYWPSWQWEKEFFHISHCQGFFILKLCPADIGVQHEKLVVSTYHSLAMRNRWVSIQEHIKTFKLANEHVV